MCMEIYLEIGNHRYMYVTKPVFITIKTFLIIVSYSKEWGIAPIHCISVPKIPLVA